MGAIAGGGEYLDESQFSYKPLPHVGFLRG